VLLCRCAAGARPPCPGRGGSCLRERFCPTEPAAAYAIMHGTAMTARKARRRKLGVCWSSRLAVTEGEEGDGQAADRPDGRVPHRVGLCQPVLRPGGLARGPGGGRRGGEVGSERAQLGVGRAVSAWPVRASSSSLVSRSCTNAALSRSITCSRSAWAALRWPRPAAVPSSGPVITGTSPAARCRQSVARLLPPKLFEDPARR
jgi:hypothetical protein